MDYFSKLPNKIFIGTQENKSLLQETNNDKIILILDYLYTNTNRKSDSIFTLENLITSTGFKLNRNKGKINDQFKNLLVQLQELKIISSKTFMKNISLNQYIKCKLNFDLDNNFIQLYQWEKDRILNIIVDKTDNLKLLTYYCYLKARMYKRENNKDLFKDTEMAEACYPSFKTITTDLKLSEETINKYNKILKDNKLIEYKNAGKWYYKLDEQKVKRETPNFYVLYKDGCESELEAAIKHYKKQHSDVMVFTNQGYKNNDRKTNGYIGRIEYLEQLGRASDNQISTKNKLIEKRNIARGSDNRTFIVKSLFQNYEGMLLSDIYYDKGQNNNAKKELLVENNLGLVDNNDKLLVDYEYYKWVMMNYKDEQHDYFTNCINKHKSELLNR